MNNGKYLVLALCIVACRLGSAQAALIDDPGDLNAGKTVIGFEEPTYTVGDPAPIVDGLVTITTSGGSMAVHAQAFTQHAGIFEGQYFGHAVTSYFLDFSSPVAEFGMGVFDPNLNGTFIRALDPSNTELERATVGTDAEFPGGPPGGSHSTFVGFVFANNVISRIELVPAGNDVLGIDNVSSYRVPEPAALTLLGMGGLDITRTPLGPFQLTGKKREEKVGSEKE